MARNNITYLIAGLLTGWLSVSAHAEITGSGLRSVHCDGKLDLHVWLDANNNGLHDGSETGLTAITITLSKVDAADLGSELLVTDASGIAQIDSLCEGVYALDVDSGTAPPGSEPRGLYEHGSLIATVEDNEPATVALGANVDDASSSQRQVALSFTELDCSVDATAACGAATVAVGESEDYHCDKPVSELSVVWNGADAVRVVAHAGKLDDPVIADFDRIVPGQVVTLAGLEDSGDDLVWEIYEAGSDTKIGESNFHLSCSDDSMDGPEDCGLAAGDGKNNDKCTDDNCINDWQFAGLIDKENEIHCLSVSEPAPDAACLIFPGGAYAVDYRLTNSSDQSVTLSDIVETSSPDGVTLSDVAVGQTARFAYFGQATADIERRLSAQGSLPGSNCGVISTAAVSVIDLPPACESVALELREVKHDAVKIRLTNNSYADLVLTQYQFTWPQEHQRLREVKWDGNKLWDTELNWEPLTVHGVDDFLLDEPDRTLVIDDHIEVEIKFDEHVHNSPQVYDLELTFDAGCSITYSVMP